MLMSRLQELNELTSPVPMVTPNACLAPITDHAVVRKASKSCALDVL